MYYISDAIPVGRYNVCNAYLKAVVQNPGVEERLEL
jgi:hypothetical protein